MTRPAVIIGLGGTGQQAVLWLKKDLIEIGKGKLPEEVRLLAFDSASRIDPQEGVELENEIEYFQVGAPLYGLVESILDDQQRAANGAEARLSHLHWFPAKEALPLGHAALNTRIGCGAYRPLGRLSLFNKVDAIVQKISGAIAAVGQHAHGSRVRAGDSNLLEILVVGSFAGGTGAGMFVDIGWLVRAAAEQLLADKYVLRGFFLLPSGFDNMGDGGSKRGRGFAAWRELDRAQNMGGSTNIIYNPANPMLNVSTKAVCYDVSYLLDPRRARYPLATAPEEGIFPAIAHAMSLMLDKKSGNGFTEYWSNIYMGIRAGAPKGVYHSAFGCYSLKVPVYSTESLFSQSLAIETVDMLLKPIYTDPANLAGSFAGLAANRNLEKPTGWSGAAAAHAFLMQDTLVAGPLTFTNTPWLKIIGKLQNEANLPMLISRLARSTLSGQMFTYFDAFNQVPDPNALSGAVGAAAAAPLVQVTAELQWSVWQEAAPSRSFGDTPEQAFKRLTSLTNPKGVAMVFARKFGEETTFGTGEGTHGEFGVQLQKLKVAQLGVFRNMLTQQLLVDLNGSGGNAVTNKTGKLGYVREFCKGLSAQLDEFSRFVRQVREMRSAQLIVADSTKAAIVRAQKDYQDLMGKTCIFTFWDSQVHPEAHRAQRRYLKAVQVDMDRRRGDIFLIAMAETVAEMKGVVDGTLNHLDKLVAQLMYGEQTIKGLRSLLAANRDNVVANQARYERLGNRDFGANQTFKGVSQTIAKREFVPNPAMVEDLLASFHWTAAPEAGAVQLGLSVEFPAADAAAAVRTKLSNDAVSNEKVIVKLCARQYTRLQAQVSQELAVEVANIFVAPGDLARALQDHAGVYFRQIAGGVAANPLANAAFLRVNSEVTAPSREYFNGFSTEYMALHVGLGLAGNLNRYESEDHYKLTLMHVADLIPSKSFQMWHDCEEDYQQLMSHNPANAMHIFPAEQNSAYYEQRIPVVLHQDFRVLLPEVTALLEDREKLSLFFRAYAMGFIALRSEAADGVQSRFWGCKLNDGELVHLTNLFTGNDNTAPFDLARNFLRGHDVRPGRGEVVLIRWADLKRVLILKEHESPSNARSLYRKQMRADADGLVARIKGVRNMGGLGIGGEVTVRQSHNDLADVAELIYGEACDALPD